MSSDNLDTKPTIETVLERISELGTKLEAQIAGIRSEISDGFAKLGKKIDIMNRELLDLKAEHEQLRDRVDSIERKAS